MDWYVVMLNHGAFGAQQLQGNLWCAARCKRVQACMAGRRSMGWARGPGPGPGPRTTTPSSIRGICGTRGAPDFGRLTRVQLEKTKLARK